MKYIILVGDGMGDLPLSDLEGKTPLEAADTPTIDHLCQHGELFRLQTIPTGMPPGSDIANLSLLGYEPQHFYTGRAPLEDEASVAGDQDWSLRHLLPSGRTNRETR